MEEVQVGSPQVKIDRGENCKKKKDTQEERESGQILCKCHLLTETNRNFFFLTGNAKNKKVGLVT